MSDIDTVLERLVTDADFRRLLAAEPARALHGYDLSAQERDMLLVRVSPDTMVGSTVEQRTSKAGMFALLGEAAALVGSHSDLVGASPVDHGSATPSDPARPTASSSTTHPRPARPRALSSTRTNHPRPPKPPASSSSAAHPHPAKPTASSSTRHRHPARPQASCSGRPRPTGLMASRATAATVSPTWSQTVRSTSTRCRCAIGVRIEG